MGYVLITLKSTGLACSSLQRTATMGRASNRRKKTPPFIMLDKSILRSKEFSVLSFKAVKLLLDVMEQYNGNNNGDMCVTMKVAKRRAANDPKQSLAVLHRCTYLIGAVTMPGNRGEPYD
jgi:hypothetical protein